MNQPESIACSIVLLGQFNPAIFHPAWLEAKGIETLGTAAYDGDLLTHRDVASFSIDDRSYHVRPDRFQIETPAPPWVTILDITIKIFAEHLMHTPITAFGVNRTVHFRLSNISSRIKLGRMLAPIEPWGEYGQGMVTDDVGLTGGLQSLVMRQINPVPDEYSSETSVTIEPSVKISDHTGVYMHVNCHHALKTCRENMEVGRQ
ncbi:MAG: hypothetical protein F4X92_03065 [Gammaproteobacteria bacterium]|nr:hypothetical protein [Gammaproteobacteria bacterium]